VADQAEQLNATTIFVYWGRLGPQENRYTAQGSYEALLKLDVRLYVGLIERRRAHVPATAN
jgi:hypothetical protein